MWTFIIAAFVGLCLTVYLFKKLKKPSFVDKEIYVFGVLYKHLPIKQLKMIKGLKYEFYPAYEEFVLHHYSYIQLLENSKEDGKSHKSAIRAHGEWVSNWVLNYRAVMNGMQVIKTERWN